MPERDEAYEHFARKISAYSQAANARVRLDQYWPKLKALFSNASVRDFVFEPFKGVFASQGGDSQSAIRQTITTVALVNMVLAGLPGKLGVGVLVSMAMEGYMAFFIASKVGVSVQTPGDIWKYFGLLASVIGTILYLMRTLVGLAFSFFAMIPGLPATAMAELFATNLVGVLFWVGFEEAKMRGSFRIPRRAFTRILQELRSLYSFLRLLPQSSTPAIFRRTRLRMRLWAKRMRFTLATSPQ